MSKKDKQRKKKQAGCEHKSDRRTAEFVARTLDEVQEQLSDLVPDLRTFEHYSEVHDAAYCLWILQRLKKRYRRFAENGVWEACD